MDFTSIGKLGSYVKQQTLAYAANYRIKTGQRIVDDSGRLNFSQASMFDQVSAAQKKSQSEVNAARLAAIKQKLRSGKELTEAEMNFLRENEPATYKKAKYAQEVREELRSELKAAETKSEARQAVMRAMVRVAADASAEFEALKNGGGGGGGGVAGVGADMNAGGDLPADVNVEGAVDSQSLAETNTDITAESADAAVEGAENNSAGENVDGSENDADKNSVAQDGDKTSAADKDEDSDSAFEILDKFIIAMRAIQDEWYNFSHSDEYKDLPEDFMDATARELHGGRKGRVEVPNFQALDAVLAYRTAMDYGGSL